MNRRGFSLAALWEVFWTACKLGLTSFGGPIAHIGYFRDEYVVRRQWLNERAFADLVALCQFLPGPASSQLGMAIGAGRAGIIGAIAAWIGFTLPSAILMIAFAYGADVISLGDAGWLQGLKLAAVAIVAQAVWSMSRSLAPDRLRGTLALGAAGMAILLPGMWGQLLPLLLCAGIGFVLLKPQEETAIDGEGSEYAADDRPRCRCMHACPIFSAPVPAAALKPLDRISFIILYRWFFPRRLTRIRRRACRASDAGRCISWHWREPANQ